jgi:hypothetical protein
MASTGGYTGGSPPQLTEGWLYRKSGVHGAQHDLRAVRWCPRVQARLGVTMLRITHPITKAIVTTFVTSRSVALVGTPMTFYRSRSLLRPGAGRSRCSASMVGGRRPRSWISSRRSAATGQHLRSPRDDVDVQDVPSWSRVRHDPIDVPKGRRQAVRCCASGRQQPRCEYAAEPFSSGQESCQKVARQGGREVLPAQSVSVTGPVSSRQPATEGFRQIYLPVRAHQAQLPAGSI